MPFTMDAEFLRVGLALLLGGLLVSAGIEDARTREIADGKSIAIALIAPIWWWANGASLWPGVPIQLAIGAGTFLAFAAMLMTMAIVGGGVTAAMLVQRRWKGGEIEVPYGVAIAIAGLLALHEPILNHFS